ncbi:MAG: hypothetical protein SPJ79_06650 [Prevotella sp.]|nr:hypothetical protein [Bacteroidales bacterium]MDY5877249.1 hypothetical protein [Prevotella sp.]
MGRGGYMPWCGSWRSMMQPAGSWGQQETRLLSHEKPSAGGWSWYAGDAVAWAGRRAEMTAMVMGDVTIGSVL